MISYDHRDHGRSSGADEHYRIEQLACDLADVLVALEVRESVTLVGQSMGGMVALTYLGRPTQTDLSPRSALVELVEAATRSGRSDIAADSLGRLAVTTRASGTE